jgi:hypothetical protein
LFLWINTHTLSNPAFNISPFFAGSVYASPNVHDAFFFSFTEIFYQTHCMSPFLLWGFLVTERSGRPCPFSVMPMSEGWKLLARDSAFRLLGSKALERFYPAMCLLHLMQGGSARWRPRR